MNRGSFSPSDKLIFDVQGVIVELKREYFTKNVPLNDDETLVHKLCVRLENVLRYGAREKYTFMGIKKDYWNYIVDCIQKDETVKFVQSISDVKTYQGKGRAFLRQALMEKSLADALQRCAINERMTKEYYVTDSVLRNSQQLQTLIHSLYDLNAVDFQLPHKGYDLDRSFPSFARKTFENRRRSSMNSYNEEDLLPADPVQILNTNVDNLVHVVTTWLGKSTGTPKTLSAPSLQRLIEKVIILGEDLTKIKLQSQNEIETLNLTISKLKADKLESDAENQRHISQLNAKFSSIEQIENTAATDKLKNLYDKLVATELKLTESDARCSLLAQDTASTKKELENTLEDYENLKSEKKDMQLFIEKLQRQVSEYQSYEHSHDSTNKILESKLIELQKINDTLTVKEKERRMKLIEKESLLKTKENELISLQDAFQKSTGLVVGSFQEFKEELNSQLKEKTKVLQTVTGVNESLSHEAKSLMQVNSELEEQLNIFEKKYVDETKKKEEAQKVIGELKLRLTEEKSHQMTLLQFVNDVSETVLKDNPENVDNVDGTDWHIKNNNKHSDSLKKLSSIDERELTLRRLIEKQKELVQLKKEKSQSSQQIVQVTQELNSLTTKFEDLNVLYEKQLEMNKGLQKNSEELRKEIAKLNIEIEKYNGEIFNMSIEISKLNKGMIQSEESAKRATSDLVAFQSQHEEATKLTNELKENNESLSHELSVTKHQLEKTNEENVSLKSKFDMMETAEKHTKAENEEFKNALIIKAEEIQSLKFQLSTEEMKKESVMKELSDTEKMQRSLVEQLSEREVKLKTIETEQSQHMTTLEIENETLANENTNLRLEYDESKEKCEIAEKEITFLKIEVAKLAKEKEEEKATRINGWNRLNNVIEEKKQMDAEYKEKIRQLTEDIDELKTHAMNLTRDKHELWTMKDQMEFELKQKADDRWVDDKEVKHCTNCKGIFSLTLRKHHCRLCGHIFCHNCSNRWLKTAHSKKKVRACGICADMYSDNREGSDSVDGERNDSILSFDRQSVQSESIIDYSKSEERDDNEDSPADNSFEFLDPAEVSSSGAFGPLEQIRMETADIKHPPVVPAVNDEEQEVEFTTKEKAEYQIAAGQRCLVPVLVGSAKFELTWEFESSPKDIGFGIAFKENEEKEDDTVQTCIPLSRYISHKQIIHGRMKIEQPGIYYFIFNNSYSRLTAKQVRCSFALLQCK